MSRIPLSCVFLACSALVLTPAAVGQVLPSDDAPAGLSAADWIGIRQAYEQGRHEARAEQDGYLARNPLQQWTTRFDGRGFTTKPETGDWTWGLQLQRYGFAGSERAPTRPARMSAEGRRVAYDWDTTLTEWYVNETRGLEHGYTVHRRPAGSTQDGPLTITLSVRGGLAPAVAADGRGVHFTDADGATALTYTGLTVFDADGHALPARFDRVAGELLLTVDERGARYPLTIDPVAQQAYLKASNSGNNDEFGQAVAVSGDTVVVGADLEDSSATGVNGDQGNGAFQSGAAYVFVRNGAGWSQQAYLKASNTDAGDFFGGAIAISGDTVVVGAIGERSNATGVNGDETDDSLPGAGAAYVFVRSGSDWSQEAYLKASNTGQGDSFGYAVAVDGDRVVVGAYWEDSNGTGVDGNQSDNSAIHAGAAYVFARSGTTWSQSAYLKAASSDMNDLFGQSVGVSGSTVVIGVPGESSIATGVNGDPTDNSAQGTGATYVFFDNGTTWTQQAYLKASNSEQFDHFGRSVSASGETVLVGAYLEDSSASGVNGDETDNSLSSAGAAYVFTRTGSTWSQQAYLKASNPGLTDFFGFAVSVSGDAAVVGAFQEDSSATGVDGDQGDGTGDSGAAYVFTRSGTTWSQAAYLKASNTGFSDEFGGSVGIDGDTVVAGAREEDSGSDGVNGDQGDGGLELGACYVFDLEAWPDMGSALAGVSGDPLLVGTGTLADFSSNGIALGYAAPDEASALFVSITSTPVPFKGGTLLAFPWVISPIFQDTSLDGGISLPFTMPSGLPSSATLWFQYGIQDAAAVAGIALSNAIVGTTP
jgi:hypothetical protein